MDNTIQLNESVMRGKFTLPSDASIINVMDLDEDTRNKVGSESNEDMAITRTSVRTGSRIVDSEFSELLSHFRTPATIPTVIANFCKDKQEHAEQILQDALPILLDLVRSSILVSEYHEGIELVGYQFAVGDYIAHYEITQQLQLFSDSEVYQAIDEQKNIFAIKVVRPNAPESITEKLQHEAAVLQRVGSSNSVRLVAQGTLDACFWFAMPWVQGTSIDKVAAEYRATRNWPALKELFVSVVTRYQYLHTHNVLHGDIHPGNILVDSDNQAHLIDFGNASLINVGMEAKKVQRGGVAFYFEPEYANAMLAHTPPPKVTELSEQFSLCALLYYLATGNYYDDFELEHTAMYQAIANPKPKSFDAQGQTPWPDLEALLSVGLSQDKHQRFDKLSTMIKQLIECDCPSAGNALVKETELKRFVDSVLKLVSVNQTLYNSPFECGPTCSVNGGSAGIAYALYKLACSEQSPDLLSQAQLWYQRARIEQGDDQAFKHLDHAKEYESVGCVSIHHAEPGISFIGLLISLSKNDFVNFELELEQFIQEIDQPCEQKDATLGKLSAILAMVELLTCVKHSGADVLSDVITKKGTQLLNEIWQHIGSQGSIGKTATWHNLGFAHGWAGLIYSTLLWHKQTDNPLPAEFNARVEQLTDCLHSQGRGSGIEWLDEQGNSMGMMAGWCNGSAGLVHLYCLLYEHQQDQKWLDIAEQLAWHVWESDASPTDLCCGSAGRIFALLNIADYSKSKADWLQRAKQLAQFSVEHADQIVDEEHAKHSLFKGQLGVALAIKALLNKDRISMPMMGVF